MKNRDSVLTQAIVRELLEYDRVNGTMRWRYRDQSWFMSYRSYRSWNAKWAGKLAFTQMGADGNGKPTYPVGRVLNETHAAHRIAWLYVKGELPQWPLEIDHKDRDKLNYRFKNLHKVKRAVNMRNKDYAETVGVRETRYGSFEARISIDGRAIALGNFATQALAIKARRQAEASVPGYR